MLECFDKQVYVVDKNSGEALAKLRVTCVLRTIAVDRDGKRTVVGGNDGLGIGCVDVITITCSVM